MASKTPGHAWSRKKQVVYRLRIFGFIAYAHNLCAQRVKLDDKTMSVFISYYEQSKAFKLFCLTLNKYFVSRDVKFDESSAWDWTIDEIGKNRIQFD